VFSEVCILLDLRCLRPPFLYSVGLIVLQDHTNNVCHVAATMYGENKAHGVLDESLIVETAGSSLRESCRNAH
jgi:hypothetical protein